LLGRPPRGFLARIPEEVAELEEVQTMFLCKMRHQPRLVRRITIAFVTDPLRDGICHTPCESGLRPSAESYRVLK
jgi:hypothetical protein